MGQDIPGSGNITIILPFKQAYRLYHYVEDTMMKNTTLIAAAAVIAAGIGSYLVRKRFWSRKENTTGHFSHKNGRHLVTAFAKTRSSANKYHWNCR